MIRITKYAGVAKLDVLAEPVVAATLTVRTLEFGCCDNGPVDHRSTVRAYCIHGDDELVIAAGHVPRVCEALQRHGYQVTILDKSDFWQLNEANRDYIASYRPFTSDWRFLDAISANPRGQIVTTGPEDRLHKLAHIRMLYPDLRLIILVKTRRDQQYVARRLRELTDIPVHTDIRKVTIRKPHTLVACTGLGTLANPERYDIFVLADGTAAPHQVMAEAAFWDSGMLTYALVRDDQRMDAATRIGVEAVFGPVIYAPATQTFTPVVVCPVGPFSYPAESPSCPLERKRRQIWHNDARNRHIARIARAAANSDMDALRSYGIPSSVLNRLQEAAGNEPEVEVLVEVPEHGKVLSKLLPGWELATAMTGPADDCADMYLGPPNRKVITRARAKQTGIIAHVAIRADGTASDWGDSSPHYYDTHIDLQVIVDVMDDFDEEAAIPGLVFAGVW